MSGALPSARKWMGAAGFPWPPFAELPDAEPMVACFCVAEVQPGLTRTEKPFLRLRLVDRHGTLDGMVWEDAERIAALVEPGAFVGVRGRLETFRGQRQLKIEEVGRLELEPSELELFLPGSERDGEEMAAELEALIASVRDPGLRALLESLLSPGSESGEWFRHAPAAKRNHHACIGGLLEHTLSVAGACDLLARHYGPRLDRDLLIAGALLHDIGKVRELARAPGFPYTDEGRLLGHILIGLEMVERVAREIPSLGEERRTLLLHLIASHQGRYEWHSPREPLTAEAMLLHYVDDLDAKLFQVLAKLGEVEEGWTGYDRSFGREFLRHRTDADAAAEPPGPREAAAAERPEAEPPAPDEPPGLFD